jgi:hypothetical protein
VAHWDGADGAVAALVLAVLVVLRSASSDQHRGGGGGCSQCAPCMEKGGAGRKFWPGGGRCIFNCGGGCSLRPAAAACTRSDRGGRGLMGEPLLQSRVVWATAMRALDTVTAKTVTGFKPI